MGDLLDAGSQRGPFVIAAVDDMFFATKIETTAKAAGIELVTVPTAKELWRELDRLVPDLIILDLNSTRCAPLETIKRLKSDPRLSGARLIGFLSHVQADLYKAAHSAGCDLVLPRSEFSSRLPQLLGK